MNNRKLIATFLTFLSVAFCLTALLPGVLAQSPTTLPAPSAPAQRVRQLSLSQDAWLLTEAKDLAKKYPTDLEVNAWYVALFPMEQTDDRIAEMRKNAPDSPWTLLAGTVTASGADLIARVEKAVEKSKNDFGVFLLATEVLKRARSREVMEDSLLAFVSAHKAAYERLPTAWWRRLSACR
jgi:hypothetical protein